MLIGITGQIGSGKSTVAQYLCKKQMTEYFIAKPLKDFAISIGFEYNEIYGTQAEKTTINKHWQISGREFLQKFGTQVVRDHTASALPNMKLDGKTLWIRTFEIYLEKNPNSNVVVSDVRFEDEAKVIKDRGGYIIKIEDNKVRDSVENKDISETSMEKIKPDFIIRNIGTIADLYAMVDDVLARIADTNLTADLHL